MRLEVEVRDSPSDEEKHLSARAAVDISVYPYTGGNDQVSGNILDQYPQILWIFI